MKSGSRDRRVQTFSEHRSHLWSRGRGWGARDGGSWYPIWMRQLIELEDSNTHQEMDYNIHIVDSLLNATSGLVYAKNLELFEGLEAWKLTGCSKKCLQINFSLFLKVHTPEIRLGKHSIPVVSCSVEFVWEKNVQPWTLNEAQCESAVFSRAVSKALLGVFKDFPRILLLTRGLE